MFETIKGKQYAKKKLFKLSQATQKRNPNRGPLFPPNELEHKLHFDDFGFPIHKSTLKAEGPKKTA